MEPYPPPSYSAILPIVIYSPPPPPPSSSFSSPIDGSQTIANPNLPSSSTPTPLSPTLPISYLSPPPPPLPTLPPQASQPPSISSPPPSSTVSPPLVSNYPPPLLPSYSSPPPPLLALSSPPPSVVMPPISPIPPPSLLSSPLPPAASPPINILTPPPSNFQPLPPLVNPPMNSSPPPPPASVNLPTNSPPPPLLSTPTITPPPPVNLPTELPLPSPLARPPISSSAPVPLPSNLLMPPVRPPTRRSPPPLPLPSPTDRSHSSNFTENGRLGLAVSNSARNNGISNETSATIATVAGFVMVAFIGAFVWFARQRKRPVAGGFFMPGGSVMAPPIGSLRTLESSYSRSPAFPLAILRNGSENSAFAYSSSDPGLGNSRSWFSYEELYSVTGGFSTQNLLGGGGFGSVYKGQLQDGREVAVKQLKVGGSQGEREFKAEVETISRVHHRHLVSLVGYCILEQQRLLVYDYVPNNTLYHHLHGKGKPVMDWAVRVKIASGAARGIAYLHEDCHPRIIHRDIKSSNILLGNDFHAQVSDFGLARLAMDACTHVTTRVMGTFGYLAPEYASTGKLTAKSDVYSFGVVLLELITGRKPVDTSQPLGDESLVEWARPLLSHALDNGGFGELPDPGLRNCYNESEMLRVIEAAAACVRHSAAMRPTMGQVVRALDSLAESDITNGVKPGDSEIFNSGPQSEEIRTFQRNAFRSQDCSRDLNR